MKSQHLGTHARSFACVQQCDTATLTALSADIGNLHVCILDSFCCHKYLTYECSVKWLIHVSNILCMRFQLNLFLTELTYKYTKYVYTRNKLLTINHFCVCFFFQFVTFYVKSIRENICMSRLCVVHVRYSIYKFQEESVRGDWYMENPVLPLIICTLLPHNQWFH